MPRYEFVAEDHNDCCRDCIARPGTGLCARFPDDCLQGGHFRVKPWWKFWGETITTKEVNK